MRGYQRKIVYLKNTGSPYFEQAYFVVRDDVNEDAGTVPRLSDEADRILGEHVRPKKRGFFYKRELLFFLAGVSVALGLSVMAFLICFR